MASRTTIIESNRKIAYNAVKEATLSNNAITDQTGVSYSKNRWQTHIPDGIQVQVGDEIQLEAAMINAAGAGDQVLEFNGYSGLKYNGEDLRDNSCSMEIEFYISNLYQFNFNLPKSRHSVDYDKSKNTYGGPAFTSFKTAATDIDNFNAFEGCYPYQATEGQSTDPTVSPRVYTDIASSLLPSIMKPPPDLAFPNDRRIFVGRSDYFGPYFEPTIDQDESIYQWNTFKQEVLFNLPEGFSTPAAVAERLTAQLHSRQGNAFSWDATTQIPDYYIMNDNGTITPAYTPSITDSSYITIPTSQGRLFQQRIGGKWHCAFEGEKNSSGTLVPRGTGYRENEGKEAFYAYMMSARPNYMNLVNLNAKFQRQPCDNVSIQTITNNTAAERNKFTLYTGLRTEGGYTQEVGDTIYHIGMINSMRLMNTLNAFIGNIDYSTLTTPPQNNILDPKGVFNNSTEGDLIVSNLIFNDINLKFLADAFESYGEYVNKETQSTDITDPQFRSVNSIPFNFFRIDDQETGSYEKHFKLPSFLCAGEEAKYNLTNGTVGHCYAIQNLKPVGATATTSLRPLIDAVSMLDKSEGRGRDFRINTYLPDDFTATKIYNDITQPGGIDGDPNYNNQNPAKPYSEFQAIPNFNGLDYIKELYNQIPKSKLGAKFCFIPVFINSNAGLESELPTVYNNDIPFIAFRLNKVPDPPFREPFPARGEFCGFDPTLSRTQMAKASTTQKIISGADAYPQPTSAVNCSIDKYMGSCFVGASDATINFDGNYSRMTMSDFHTPIKNGNGQFQNPKIPPSTDPLQDIISTFYNQSCMVQLNSSGTATKYNQNPVYPKYPNNNAAWATHSCVSAQSGIAITDIRVPFVDNSPIYAPSRLISLNYVNSQYYKDTLFDKLGFSLEQLKPRFGLPYNQFNRGNYNKYLGYGQENNAYLVQNNMVKPFTTNAYISASEQISFAQMIAAIKSGTNTTYEIVPSANLGLSGTVQAETNAVSDLLIAASLPRKLDFPYLVVYSDIVQNPSYYGGPSGFDKLNAISYITRNYSEGDYFFSFATNWNYIADKDYIITSITTDIRLPDGRPAPIDENSSVIYKITKPQIMPIAPQIQQPKQKKSSDDKPENRSQANKKSSSSPSSRTRSKSMSSSSGSSSY